MTDNKFKCSKCGCIKDETEYGKNKNKQRSKTCKKCIEYKEKYYEERDAYNFKLSKDWKPHPEYKNICCDTLGHVLNKKTKKLIGQMAANGYIQLSLDFNDDGTRNIMQAHNFIWVSLKGEIPKGKIINHINEIKNDNRIENLECVSKTENNIKSSKKISGPRKPRKCCGINQNTEEEFNFKSLSDASRKTGCGKPSIGRVCDGTTNSTTSKITNEKWIFQYN